MIVAGAPFATRSATSIALSTAEDGLDHTKNQVPMPRTE